jgi:hypothetical protein
MQNIRPISALLAIALASVAFDRCLAAEVPRSYQFGAVSLRGDALPVADEAMSRPLRPRQCYLRAVSRPRSTRRICLIGALGGHFVLQSPVDAVEDMLCHTLSNFALAHDN